jgi:hypothetical protein
VKRRIANRRIKIRKDKKGNNMKGTQPKTYKTPEGFPTTLTAGYEWHKYAEELNQAPPPPCPS